MPFIRIIDAVCRAAGIAGAFALPLLMLTILLNVVLRYGFGRGMIELEELQWHLNAFCVMACLAWAYQCDTHVRVDALHNRLGPRGRALCELLGVIFLLLPFAGFVTWNAWQIFSYSLSLREGSPMPSGLPARYIIKGIMVAGFGLLFLQGLAIMGRAILVLRGRGSLFGGQI